jgi:hypothetical protein
MDNSLNSLKVICDQIGTAIALDIDKDNPSEIIGKINELTCLLSTSSHAVAVAEMVYSEKLMNLTEDNRWTKLTATDKKMVFAGRAKDEIYYVTLTERQNKALTHSIDGLRSMLSYLKSEVNNLN